MILLSITIALGLCFALVLILIFGALKCAKRADEREEESIKVIQSFSNDVQMQDILHSKKKS